MTTTRRRRRRPTERQTTTGDGAPAVGDGVGGVDLARLGNFAQPVYVTEAQGDPEHLYVVEQCGKIIRIPVDGGEGTTFLDISDQVTCQGEQGLLSVAFAPDYADSGRLLRQLHRPRGRLAHRRVPPLGRRLGGR